jgi:ATP/maltotriose-dependent transcriptional regulator MalT
VICTLLSYVAAPAREEGIAHKLSHRERQVLGLVASGFGNAEIASFLCIRRATVKNHVHNILAKLSVGSRRDAARVWQEATSGSPAAAKPLIYCPPI